MMKMSSAVLAGGAAAVLAMAAASAFGQDAGAGAGAGAAPAAAPAGMAGSDMRAAMRDALTFEKMDADKDGKVTMAEYQAAMAKVTETRFKAMDTNGDGVLSKEEVENSRGGPRRGGQPGGPGRPGGRQKGGGQGGGAPEGGQK